MRKFSDDKSHLFTKWLILLTGRRQPWSAENVNEGRGNPIIIKLNSYL